MTELHISNIPTGLTKQFTTKINKLRPGGAKKGDKSKFAIEAIKQWLDNTTPKDRGYLFLQKEIDELKAENRRLDSAENPTFKRLMQELRDKEAMIQQLKDRIVRYD